MTGRCATPSPCPTGCPLVRMDAREPRSCMDALVALVEHALARSLG